MAKVPEVEPNVVYSWIPYNFLISIRDPMREWWAARRRGCLRNGIITAVLYLINQLILIGMIISLIVSLVSIGIYGMTSLEQRPVPATYAESMDLPDNLTISDAERKFQFQKKLITQSYLRIIELGMKAPNENVTSEDYVQLLQTEADFLQQSLLENSKLSWRFGHDKADLLSTIVIICFNIFFILGIEAIDYSRSKRGKSTLM